MDWKFFPPAQALINGEEQSQKINRVSVDQLFHNLDALLKRDVSDCLSKQLEGLLKNYPTIYQIRSSVQRRERCDYFEAGEDSEKGVNCKMVQRGGRCNQLALKCLNTSVHNSQSLQSKSSCSVDAKPSTAFESKKLATPPQILWPTRSIITTDARKNKLKFERLPLTLESDRYDVLPSDGWWRRETSDESASESETEAEVINDAKSNSGLNVDVCSSPESVQSLFSSVVLNYCNDGSNAQTPVGSSAGVLSKIQGMQSEELLREASEISSFLNLTSGFENESGIIMAPRPPQPTPDMDDKTCQTCSENYSLSSCSRSTSFASDAAIFGEDLKLGYRELFHYHLNTKSRIDNNKLEALKHNYLRPDKKFMPMEENSSQKYLNKHRKITCVFPNVNASSAKSIEKSNKAIPVVLQRKAVKRRPNTADIPVKLRLQHRSNAFAKLKVNKENGAHERVLPTTLNKSAQTTYSLMTPYMANVVWSVMDDENVI